MRRYWIANTFDCNQVQFGAIHNLSIIIHNPEHSDDICTVQHLYSLQNLFTTTVPTLHFCSYWLGHYILHYSYLIVAQCLATFCRIWYLQCTSLYQTSWAMPAKQKPMPRVKLCPAFAAVRYQQQFVGPLCLLPMHFSTHPLTRNEQHMQNGWVS